MHLNWDNSGVQLLIATEDGQVEVYGMLEDLLNKWKLLYSGQFPGEPILTSCWLSAARQVRDSKNTEFKPYHRNLIIFKNTRFSYLFWL